MQFTKNLLSASVAMAVASTNYAYAQAATEEVIVTGIRGSLMRAMDVKRDAKGVVDAISAEDIGKMPDTNLAESLQRITGVSIDRDRGEGSKVTVRGFGPGFNLVTLNGRQMPTQDPDGSRSFDFANIASEGVAGVEIYKTGKAHVPTGGIGATINVLTTKPLNNPGFKSSVGIKGVHDTSTDDGSDLTPEISGIIQNTFADDTFGVALTASYQERDNGQFLGNTPDGWTPFRGDQGGWGSLPNNADQINRPQGNDIYSVPQNISYGIEEYHRERVNGQLTLQYEPVESVTATLDYTYAELSLEKRAQSMGGWFNFGGQQSEYTDGPLAAPIKYSDSAAADFTNVVDDSATKSENNSVGLNVEWRANDNLTLAFDYHDSSAENNPDSALGSRVNFNIASFTRARTTGFYDQDLPVMMLELTQPLAAEDYKISGTQFENKLAKMDIEQARFNGSWEFDETSSIDFGIETTEVKNRTASSIVERGAWGGVGREGLIADLLTPASLSGKFDEISGGGDPRLFTDYFTFDVNEMIARAEALQMLDPSDPDYIEPWPLEDAGDCGTGFCPTSRLTTDRRTTEESTAVYLQVNLEAELGDMPANISAGLRYEETDVESRALVPVYDRIIWASANEFDAQIARDADGLAIQDFTQLSGKYDFILPSIDFSLNITENLVGRISYSQTVARPNYTDIQGGLTIESRTRIDGTGEGNRGDPGLEPFESQNYDVSLEWYYGDASYASIGYFRKDTRNFIGISESQGELLFPGLAHPALSPLFSAAEAALPGDPTPEEIRTYIFANFAGEPGVDAVNEVITGVPGRDGDATFDVTVPVNIDEAIVDGWELAVQHTFGETGFGVIANATFVEGDFGYDLLSLEEQFAVTGLSDSANLIVFYDKDGLQGRIAYNWRDDFIDDPALKPVFVESYGQWDMNLSYEVTDYLTVFVEGINVTDETTRKHGRTSNDVIEAVQTGARYNIGLRASF